MQDLQYSVNEENSNREYFSKKFAKYVNVFMIRGIFSHLKCTVGHHASAGFTGDQLFPVIWEATRVLESIGFKVHIWVCDGAAPNRRFFLINGMEEEKRGRQYWTVNRYAPERKIFLNDWVTWLVHSLNKKPVLMTSVKVKTMSPVNFVCQRCSAEFQDQSMSMTRQTN